MLRRGNSTLSEKVGSYIQQHVMGWVRLKKSTVTFRTPSVTLAGEDEMVVTDWIVGIISRTLDWDVASERLESYSIVKYPSLDYLVYVVKLNYYRRA